MVKKWEYIIKSTFDNKNIFLNELGLEGWELVSVVTVIREKGFTDYKFYFKRRK